MMKNDQWQETVGRIQDTFHVVSHEVVRGDEYSGDVETLVFDGPQGRMKLERTSRPRVTGKSAIGSKRIGGSVKVQYQYSATEKVHTVKAFRWNPQRSTWDDVTDGAGNPAPQ